MTTRTIDERRWQSFADDFTRCHDGWIASLEIRDGDASPRTQVDDNAFRGATLEKHDGRATLILTFGYDPEEHFAHIIHEPRALIASETWDRTEASLRIDAGDGSSCVLALSNPMHEEDPLGA
jgi:hypothetical protein